MGRDSTRMNCFILPIAFMLGGGPQLSPHSLLEEAVRSSTGNFLLLPDLEPLRQYSWTLRFTIRDLDSKGNVRGTGDSVLLLYDAEAGIGERQGGAGGPFPDNRIAFDWMWPTRWCTVCPELGAEDSELASKRRTQVWESTDFKFSGNETLDGRSTLVFEFKTAKPSKKKRPLALHSASAMGKIWIDRDDRKVVQVEGEYYKTVYRVKGWFVSSTIPKGSRWSWRLRRMDDGTWLPVSHHESIRMGGFPWGSSFRQTVQSFSEFSRPRRGK